MCISKIESFHCYLLRIHSRGACASCKMSIIIMAAVQACIESPNDVGLRSTRDELLADLSAIVFNNEQESELTSVGHSM